MKLIFCAENFFDELQFPLHTLSASSEAAGFEAFHVATGRRYPSDRWSPSTANADHWVQANCDQSRAANFCAIDRYSNHLDKRFVVQCSSDAMVTIETAWGIPPGTTVTVPKTIGGTPGGSSGVLTSEGAWLKTWVASAAGTSWRLYSFAMGANITQQIVGAWIGQAWMPTDFVIADHADDESVGVGYNMTQSSSGWKGRTRSSRVRSGSITVRLDSQLDFDMVRYQVLGLYAGGSPAWLCFDREGGAHKAMLVSCPTGLLDFGAKQSWLNKRMITIPFEEEQAVP